MPSCGSARWSSACGGGDLPHRYSRTNGYDNPSVYCDDLYAMFENMESVLERHIYVSKPGGQRIGLRETLPITWCSPDKPDALSVIASATNQPDGQITSTSDTIAPSSPSRENIPLAASGKSVI